MSGAAPRQSLTISALTPTCPELASLASIVDRPALDQLLMACLLDLMSSVMQLSSVSFNVAAASPGHAETIRGVLPAGVNLIAPATSTHGAMVDAFIMRHPSRQGTDRTVIIRGDTVALPAATAGTAFGVLESADLVVGPTRDAHWYLIGVSAGATVETVLEASGRTATLLGLGGERGLVVRRMEPRIRLAGVNSSEALDGLRQVPGLGPRLSAWLSERFDTA